MEKPSQTSSLQGRILDFAHILVHDLNGRILFWNSGAEQMYGWTRAEALGRCSHNLLQTSFPRNRQGIIDAVLQGGSWHGDWSTFTRTDAGYLSQVTGFCIQARVSIRPPS